VGQRQASENGKQAHRLRQHRYRQRATPPSVTHQGSLLIPRAETSAAERLYRCVIRGLTSRWHNPFDWLPPKRLRRVRARCRDGAQISTFSDGR
jgi:hypothetical protein